jgi:hypothetical protein
MEGIIVYIGLVELFEPLRRMLVKTFNAIVLAVQLIGL